MPIRARATNVGAVVRIPLGAGPMVRNVEPAYRDRGPGMAQHKAFSVATDVQVYFCDPQSPWQRGTNENTNGLLRQYFAKGTERSTYAQAELNKVAPRATQRSGRARSGRARPCPC